MTVEELIERESNGAILVSKEEYATILSFHQVYPDESLGNTRLAIMTDEGSVPIIINPLHNSPLWKAMNEEE